MLDLIDKIKRRYLWFNEESVDNLKQAISALTHVRLDREHISKIENLEGLNSVTNLYLQYVSVISHYKVDYAQLFFCSIKI